ncbi:hypothetical protein IJH89_01415 [Candidatus Saccharibacteria bacterium]|nr:hypothetical protein [Candidatus Saccharibacteria bacterium]
MKHPTSNSRFKSGATSIYAVVIATLLFSVITVSFIRIIVNEAQRTAADELSQMAYDAALAGVEDAKIAAQKYSACLKNPGASSSCNDIINIAKTVDEKDCDDVNRILHGTSSEGEVQITETSDDSGSKTNQAYTCVSLNPNASDYRSTLDSSNPIRVIPLRPAGNREANDVKQLRISWHSEDNGSDFHYNNQSFFNRVTRASDLATPATLSAMIIQTGPQFSVDDSQSTTSNQTNRATAFLVPSSGGGSKVDSATLLNSNRHIDTNGDGVPDDSSPVEPSKIQCDSSFVFAGFACSATLELPSPVGGDRNNNTFFLALSLPYLGPETDFSITMLNGDEVIPFGGVQFVVDSTGRANDLISRVEARVEFSDSDYPYPAFALQAGSDGIKKDFYVTADCIKTETNDAGESVVKPCNDAGTASE